MLFEIAAKGSKIIEAGSERDVTYGHVGIREFLDYGFKF